MVNTSDFVMRLQKVMDYYGLTSSALADKLNVQASNISHLLSERNKPSLDFILKLTERFPEIDIYWITQGKGVFPNITAKNDSVLKKEQFVQANLFNDEPIASNSSEKTEINEIKSVSTDNQIAIKLSETKTRKKEIYKIVFFYTDNSFEIFENTQL
ncbi:helix-turn-helix transcriptional regulator [Capnocytophaga sp.]|uniref:helix-turn-helix domain-containing protein n=1 Tax=Capnocytophaga sp. TaxID=44737 RepID=UPI0026DD127C|nr:helix-turn-helix transcriptional regulator [Capnocytophaga sp.]MDO5104961.1 helix-turn-helix transcriptional regulator [Capnocytophaga sp.]